MRDTTNENLQDRNTYDVIMNRRSVRNYTDRPVTDEVLEKLMRAAMAGPCCVNARDWQFIAVRDRQMLNKMADANGRPAAPLRQAALGILVLGDLERAFKPAPDYWVIDGAIAAQNMILTAESLGLGSVWLGTWPQMDRVENQRVLFGLPDTVIPHSVIALGYPDMEMENAVPHRERSDGIARGAYEPDRIHYEQW